MNWQYMRGQMQGQELSCFHQGLIGTKGIGQGPHTGGSQIEPLFQLIVPTFEPLDSGIIFFLLGGGHNAVKEGHHLTNAPQGLTDGSFLHAIGLRFKGDDIAHRNDMFVAPAFQSYSSIVLAEVHGGSRWCGSRRGGCGRWKVSHGFLVAHATARFQGIFGDRIQWRSFHVQAIGQGINDNHLVVLMGGIVGMGVGLGWLGGGCHFFGCGGVGLATAFRHPISQLLLMTDSL